MLISDWSSDWCSSDLVPQHVVQRFGLRGVARQHQRPQVGVMRLARQLAHQPQRLFAEARLGDEVEVGAGHGSGAGICGNGVRSEEHTSELQSLMRISYAVFCLKKKNKR